MTGESADEILGGVAGDPDAPAGAAVVEAVSSYLVFRLGRVWYAVPTSAVKEVVPRAEAVTVPQTPAFVRGLLNVGGRIVVLLELGSLLGHAPTAPSEVAQAQGEIAPRDLVMHVGAALVGFRVDEVTGLAEIPTSKVQRVAAEGGSPVIESFLLSERAVSVLDVSRLIMLAEAQVGGR